MSKQPLYTALGWTVWQLSKHYARKKVGKAKPRPSFLKLTLLSVVVSLGATFAARKLLAESGTTSA